MSLTSDVIRRLAFVIPAGLLLLGSVDTATEVSASPSHGGRGGASTGIVLQSIAFYTRFNYKDCIPGGPPVTTVAAAVPILYVNEKFSNWKGVHTVTDNFYYPNGQFAFDLTTGASSDTGPTSSCDKVRPRGHLGTWRMDVVIDGRYTASARFTVTPR